MNIYKKMFDNLNDEYIELIAEKTELIAKIRELPRKKELEGQPSMYACGYSKAIADVLKELEK